MRFNSRARLDRSQIQSRRGSRGATPGFPVGGGSGMKAGGGIGGVIVLIIIVLLNGGLLDTGNPAGGGPLSTRGDLSHCATGQDANNDPDCARLAVVNSIQSFWSEALPGQSNREYRRADTVIFSDQVGTGCGAATSDVGPFYCPPDEQVYLDTTFFRDILERELGGGGGDFAEGSRQ